MNSEECFPFILRFSRTMYRQNPRTARGGSIRTHPEGTPDTAAIKKNLLTGFSYYQKYQYNNGLPIFGRLSMKQGSYSKSLRYNFLKITGIKQLASMSPHEFIFSMDSVAEVNRLSRILKESRNAAFTASYSHIRDMNTLMPEDKAAMSCDFFHFAEDAKRDSVFCINTFADKEHRLSHFLINEMGAVSADTLTVGSFTTVKAVIPDFKSKTDKLLTHSLVRSLSPDTELTLTPNYIRHNDLTLDCVEARDTAKSYPKAAIIDSGLAETSFLKEWELDTVRFGGEQASHKHGTFVSGRLLLDNEKFGGILFLSVEMLPNEGSLSIDVFYEKMRKVLKEYHKHIKIYNISLGSDSVVSSEEYSFASYVLDSLQKEFDVLFIISAGNYEKLRLDSDDMFINDRITRPAESVHSLTVGSAAHLDTNIQLKDSPSLFTRKGPGTAYSVKPDVCAYGGAHEMRMGRPRPVGVFSIGVRNELAEDTGTSHAVPRVSALAAKLYDKYSHVFPSPDMTKAMILHYTHLYCGKSPDGYLGYGVVPDDTSGFDSLKESAVYLQSGMVKLSGIVEIPDIPVPDAMFSDGLVTGSVCLTLVYKTDTDINFPHIYTCVNLELSVGFYRNGEWRSLITSKDMLTLHGLNISGEDAKERMKWNPVKIYEKTFKNSRIPPKLVVRITPSRRDFYKGVKPVGYSLVISFTRKDKNIFQYVQEHYSEYEDLLEPSSPMWKTC